jgi:uncharacterized membrane protein
MAAREEALARGLIAAIQDCATILAEHFPLQDDDVDELSNKVIII